jgi:tetratricopeptide (TPR) repeat protein
LFALTDHQLDLPALNALLVLNLALLFQGSSAAPAVTVSRWPRFILAATLAVPLALTARDLWARHAYTQALEAFAANETATALTQLEQAAQRAPYDPYYRHQLAGGLLAQRGTTPDAEARAGLASAAAEQLRRSLAADVFQEFAHFNLAWLALDAGAPRLAVDHFRATLALAPHRGGAYFGLGLALRDAGQPAAAVRAFALEWINDPAAATAPVWELPDFAPYRIGVAREATAILEEIAATQPAATYVDALWRWWETGGPPPARGFNRESDLFLATLAALQDRQPPPAAAAAYPWGALFAAWRDHPGDFSTVAPRDPAVAAALAGRAAQHPVPAVHGFLTAPSDDSALLVTTRPARTGYGVLALHPDGPVPTDLYVRQSPRLVSGFASGLFPPKGWVPAQVLLSRLPASSPPP